jgi:iron-sulfur cluster assembly protein
MAIDAERKGDKVFEHQGAKLYIDRKSYLYLNGTQLDYSDGLVNVGFRLDNPNVKRTCGCGESFTV